jgi:O-antigen biosynthesis protein
VRVCFLTPALPAPEPIADYARRLDALVAQSAPEEEFDVAVATDWTTTAHLFAVRAKRHAFWVDHFAHRRMGTWQAERFAAQLAYDLPVDFIAAAPWIRDTLADLRPESRCELVTTGIPKNAEVPGTSPEVGMPLRVHVVGDEAREAFGTMDEGAAEARVEEADVVLMLSTVDGVLGAPLAGFRAGATAVVGPAHDAQDLVRHGENGLVADADDPRGAARFLDQLARDRELLARLQEAARATAEGWPTPEDAAKEMEAALERLVAEDPPLHAAWPVRLMGDAIGGAAVVKQELALLTAEVHRLREPAPRRPVRRLLLAVGRRAKARLER